MSTLIIEIRAAEGGEHSKRLVLKQTQIYSKVCTRRGL